MEVDATDALRAFEQAMRDAGLAPEFKGTEGIKVGQTASGTPQRYHVKGDATGTRNGWYVLHLDGVPAGVFGSFKSGAEHRWCARSRDSLSADELAEIERRVAEAKAKRDKEQRQREGEAAKAANLLWNAASEAGADAHAYLVRKGVQSHGLRVADWPMKTEDGEVYRTIRGALLIPMATAGGKIVSLQAIFPERVGSLGRDKSFMLGGRKRGTFYVIGRAPGAGEVMCLAEGYATAATIHECTGWCVAVCWDAYNLPVVAAELRKAMPTAHFVIAADNDARTMEPVENPGVTYARRAAAEVGARVVVPEFTDEQAAQWRDDNGKDADAIPTDFNDMAIIAGRDAVQAALMPQPPAVTQAPAQQPAAAALPVPAHAAGYMTHIDPDRVDLASPFPEFDGKGRPLPTARCMAELLRRINAIVRYNVIGKSVEILLPGSAYSLDNAANASHSDLRDWATRARMPLTNFDGALLTCADANPYNPVTTWIESRAWDGVSRLQEFFDTITERETTTLPDGRNLKEILMRKWLLSAVAAAYSPTGVVARGVLTFQGAQNQGKTHWVKRLAPPELGVIKDGLILDPHNRDSVKPCVSKWIVELGEVDATFRRADMAALKAFISADRDELRLAYARTESTFPRRTVFYASVNPSRFLRDDSGNTRWWTIKAQTINATHSIDVQQLWAEVHRLYESGETWHLSPAEIEALNTHNQGSEEIDPLHEMIDKAFSWGDDPAHWNRPMRATEIALSAGVQYPSKKDVNTAAAYVVKRYGVTEKRIGKDRNKAWMMPATRVARSAPPL